jgi:hypothetical protein
MSQSRDPREIARRIRGRLDRNVSQGRRSPSRVGAFVRRNPCRSLWAALSIDPSNPADPRRNRFLLSKGHAASALYAVLAFRGFFPVALVDT